MIYKFRGTGPWLISNTPEGGQGASPSGPGGVPPGPKKTFQFLLKLEEIDELLG